MNASWGKVLLGWLIVRLTGGKRRARRAEERRRLVAVRNAAAAAHRRRREELLARLDGGDDEAIRREAAQALEEEHEQIRRRRAEPPPTLEREVVSTPGMEWLVILLLLAGGLGAGGFMAFYVAYPDTQLLGLCLGGALLCLGIAAALAGKRIVPQEKVAEPYHYFGDEEAQGDVAAIVEEASEGVSRRRLIVGAAGAAGATVGAAALFPLASLGPKVDELISNTPWRSGRRVVDSDGRPIRPQDVPTGTFVLAFPEGADRDTLDAPVVLLRFRPEQLRLPAARKAAAPGGVVAYSRICTHAGCAVSMYRHPLNPSTAPPDALVCPCHYSTFDPKRGAAVVFGPAARPLPQLPMRVNASGELVAAGDFFDQVGPSYGGIRQTPPGAPRT